MKSSLKSNPAYLHLHIFFFAPNLIFITTAIIYWAGMHMTLDKSLNPHYNPMSRYHPHFIDVKTEAHRGWIPFPDLHS